MKTNKKNITLDNLTSIERLIVFYDKREREFTIMKDEIRRIKEILEIKLGVKI